MYPYKFNTCYILPYIVRCFLKRQSDTTFEAPASSHFPDSFSRGSHNPEVGMYPSMLEICPCPRRKMSDFTSFNYWILFHCMIIDIQFLSSHHYYKAYPNEHPQDVSCCICARVSVGAGVFKLSRPIHMVRNNFTFRSCTYTYAYIITGSVAQEVDLRLTFVQETFMGECPRICTCGEGKEAGKGRGSFGL